MNKETKHRLKERFAQVLDGMNDQTPQTLAQIEQMILDMREQLTKATREEVSREIESTECAESQEADTTEILSPTEIPASKIGCPHCLVATAWYKGKRSRQIVTLAGPMTLRRRYYYCRRCDLGFCPLDRQLDLPLDTGLMPRVQQEIAFLSACLPFSQAVQTLDRFTGLRVSARSAERLCLLEAGEWVKGFLQERDAKTLPLAFVAPCALPADLPKPDVLYIAADGIQTPIKGGSWKEMKIGVVQSCFKDGRMDQAGRYVNLLGDSESFGAKWESLAISCGSLGAKRLVVLGDGAAWIWSLATTRFPRAIQILDFWHALEYVGKVSREVFGEGTAASKSWLSLRAKEMKASNWQAFYAALEQVRSTACESVSITIRYFRNNASRMDYAKYLKAGLSIGSGIAESSCKRLVTQRLKGSGMHWSEVGAQAICSLRSLLLGGEWDAFVAFWNRQVLAPRLSPLS